MRSLPVRLFAALLPCVISLAGLTAARAQNATAAPATPATPAASVPAAAALPTIFVCGDSTAKNSGKGKSGEPVAGWGTPLAAYFDPAKVTINNVGHAGTSSRTYFDTDWPKVLPQIKSGDYVLLVFGINDGGRGTPNGLGDEVNAQGYHTYGWYMSKMTTDALEKGAHVYLLTLTVRNVWTNPNAKFNDATPTAPLPDNYDPKQDKIARGDKYAGWTLDVGKILGVPVLDLNNLEGDKHEKMGREVVNVLYSDHNHTYVPGADLLSSYIVSGLKAFKNSPFTALLSEKGKAVETADVKYVFDNPVPVKTPVAAPATPAAPAVTSATAAPAAPAKTN